MPAPITPLVGCDVFIPNLARTHVLLIQRADNGAWALPGGFHDPDETPATCAARECLEETGLSIRIDRLLGVFSSNCYRELNYPHKGGKYCHILFLAHPADVESEALANRNTNEAKQIGWFREHEILPLSDGHDVRIATGFKFLADPSIAPHFE